MKTTTKLSSEERRAAIINAVRSAFAEKGFDGTTTRALADAAGVSEALLFKHFPNKEALFSAMQASCCKAQYDHERLEQLMALDPSSATLVLMVHFLISSVVEGTVAHDPELAIYNRLMLRSLAEDGEFARRMLRRPASNWIPKCEQCIEAAVTCGDAVAGPFGPGLRGWFAYQLTAMIRTYLQPAKPVVDFGVSHEKLVEQAVWFILRGMGLKDEVIKRYCTRKFLSQYSA